MSENENAKEAYRITSLDAQRLTDRDVALAALRDHMGKLAALKVEHHVAARAGLPGTHANQAMDALQRQERLVNVLRELCESLDKVPEGLVYSPSDLTIVKGIE